MVVHALPNAMDRANPAWMSFVRARGLGEHVEEDARAQLDTFTPGLTATQDDGKAAEEFFGRSVAEQASQRGRTVLVDPIAAGPGSVVLNNVAIHAHRRHASQCAYITA